MMRHDASQLLNRVHRLGWRTADVEEDGEYLCSIHVDDNEVWAILTRAHCQRFAEAASAILFDLIRLLAGEVSSSGRPVLSEELHRTSWTRVYPHLSGSF